MYLVCTKKSETVRGQGNDETQSAIVCVRELVCLSGGRGRLLTHDRRHVHRASACTLNAVGLLPVSGCGDARVAPPCPTTLCVWRNLPYLTLKGVDFELYRGCAPRPLVALLSTSKPFNS